MFQSQAAIDATREARERRLDALGPRPPWWRLIARRRWARTHAEIMALQLTDFDLTLREYYTSESIERALRDQQLGFRVLRGGKR